MIPWRFGKRSLTKLAGAAGTLASTGLPWEVDRWLQDRDSLGLMDRAGTVPIQYRDDYRKALAEDLHGGLRWLAPAGALIFLMLYPVDAWRNPNLAPTLMWVRIGSVAAMALVSMPLLARGTPRFIFGTATLLLLIPFASSLFIVGATGGPYSDYLSTLQVFPFVLVAAMPMSFSRQIVLILVMAMVQTSVIIGTPWSWHAQDFGLLVNTLSSITIINLTAIGMGLGLRRMRVRNFLRGMAASQEADAADSLLRLILPATAVKQLLEHGTVAPEVHPEVTILFTDFVGFTSIAEKMSSVDLITELDDIFTTFDRISFDHGLERIKTIGDAYMAIAGLEGNEDHAQRTVDAAEEMVTYLKTRRLEHPKRPDWRVRVGAHSGPVVSGVIGGSRLAFDVWGDTVNVAARMESSSEPGKINISSATRKLLSRKATLSRGRLAAKNKGDLTMFFIRPVDGGMPRPSREADHE
jgi:class 3 adenylate cyclase